VLRRKQSMEIIISNRKIGDGHPVFFIAEAGVNHNGSLEMGKQLIDVAVEAGADAVKFQTFKAEELNTENSPKSSYHIETTGSDSKQTWFELLKTQEISKEMHLELIDYCRKRKIIFMSTPYGEQSADLLENLGIAAYKIASTDANNTPFLKYVAQKGIPMIISTAMATMEEVEMAVDTIRKAKLEQFVVLQCTGNYPSRLENTNLRVMQTYRRNLNCLVGYSDHTLDMINPVAATAMGACIFEKHFTIDKKLPGPDHRMSLEPQELKDTVSAIRQTEMVLGSLEKYVLPDEEENRVKLRKSIVAAIDIPKGGKLQQKMLTTKRPGNGIPPEKLVEILNYQTNTDIAKDTTIQFEMLEK
jgi:N,N'-diacetyllegionaminate synthase